MSTESKPIFFYTTEVVKRKNKSVQRRVAYAGVIEDKTIRIAKASCSPKDQFIKKVGRELAAERALNEPITSVYFDENARPVSMFIETVKLLSAKTQSN